MNTFVRNSRRQSAYLMTEALVYMAVVVVLLAVGYLAMDRCINNSIALRRSSDDFSRVLRVGERWRADVRESTQIRWEDADGERILRLQGPKVEVAYRFSNTNLLRRLDDGPWVPTLANARAISMESDRRTHLTTWRCEIEMEPRSRHPRFKPMFTFIAVPAPIVAP
jgi:hypothetical protein